MLLIGVWSLPVAWLTVKVNPIVSPTLAGEGLTWVMARIGAKPKRVVVCLSVAVICTPSGSVAVTLPVLTSRLVSVGAAV